MNRHVYNMGIIGNCAYNALISQDTQVMWMCLPRFDTSFIFGKLLDKDGGEFSILPVGEATFSQQYIENTNILETTVKSETGTYKVTDFAPRFQLYGRYFKPLMLFRKIERITGQPKVRVICKPVRDYGKEYLSISVGSNHINFRGLANSLRLTTDIPLTYLVENQSFILHDKKYLVLSYGAPLEDMLAETSERFLQQTITYWRNWVLRTYVPSIYQKSFIRSALVLKIHQYEDTGAVIASATMGLPEAPGTGRNWDYRYCWLRDTYYTMHVLSSIGHFDELNNYFHFLLNLQKSHTRYAPLYRISGQVLDEEHILPLEGYQGNGPIYLGNQAASHIQNDAYGQVLLALLPLYSDKRLEEATRKLPSHLVESALRMIAETMEESDAGLWEFRNQKGKHCYTYLFHWAGAHAAEKIAYILNNKLLARQAVQLQLQAAEKIEACYNTKIGGYTQKIGAQDMDASTLQLITMGYLSTDSKRAKAHLRALEKHLKGKQGLFYRYKHSDDFGVPKTTFLICAFWYVEALACVGEVRQALKYLHHLLQYSNHLGLLSEDIEERSGSQWGNFPQVYSHVGLISALLRIDRRMDTPNFLAKSLRH